MRTAMSLEEFAALVRTDQVEIRELSALGLLDPRGEGRFDDLDVLRLMTVRHWQALGYEPQRLAEGIKAGEIEPTFHEHLYPRGRPLELPEVARRIGVDVELLRELRTALGWTRPGFVEADVPVLQAFKAIADAGMPGEALLEGARVFGDTLRRLAETEVRLVHVHIHERLLAEGVSEEEVIRQIHDLEAAALPLLDSIVQHVHHEHFLQASIEDAFVHLVEPESTGGRGSVEATIVFIDVESFTTLTETEGDQAAIDLMNRVDALVRELAAAHDGKVVKHIGDALMLAFRRPADGTAFATRLHDAAADDPSMPGLRVGMHCGPAIYRGGDYIGNTVNLASRVTATATAGQTVLTEAVAAGLGQSASVEAVGIRMLRGAERPVQLYRLAREAPRRDPTCGRNVEAPPAARLLHGDEELWFCSEQCLRTFLAAAPTPV
jgi:adenylate cyclase